MTVEQRYRQVRGQLPLLSFRTDVYLGAQTLQRMEENYRYCTCRRAR